MIELQEICNILVCPVETTITLYNELGVILIIFNAGGYQSLDDELLTRTVSKVQIKSANQISIHLAEDLGQ